MKIGIITFQLAWNCGAVLQCYALQTCIEELGYDVEVINYRPTYKEYRYKKYCNPFVQAKKEWETTAPIKTKALKASKKFVRTILNYRNDSEHINQWRGFSEFTGKYLHLTNVYSSIDELRENAPICDVYISGSDQLWNPKLTNNQLDQAYFLRFGAKETRRITYAISACELDLNEYGKKLKEYTKNIDFISLREKNYLQAYESTLGVQISICPDPTLLINSDAYTEFTKSVGADKKDYILVYALEDGRGSVALFKYVDELRRHYKRKVLVICGPHKWPFPVEQIKGITPCEFVYYIKNAFCIVSNSFHATAFSVIYNKKFATLGFKNRSARMQELLDNLGLTDRMVTQDRDIISIMDKEIDYSDVEKRIKLQRKTGIDYLKRTIDLND